MVVSQTNQTSTFNALMGNSFMPSINIPNVTRHYSSYFSSPVVGVHYTPTLYNVLGAIPSGVGGRVQPSTPTRRKQQPIIWG